MNTLRNSLLGLFAVQCVLAVGLFIHSNAGSSNAVNEPLLAFEPSQLDKIVIGGSQGDVVLSKQENSWRLPELHNLPVDGDKLSRALDKLAGLTSGWPVATTKSSHDRFEVSEDNHQRRIQLYSGGETVAELYLGSSPGFRKVHARNAATSEVYSLPANTYDFPVKSDNWLDKKLLAVENMDVIKGADFELISDDENWTLTGAPIAKGYELDSAKVEAIGRTLKNLNVTGVADLSPNFNADHAVNLEIKGDGITRFQFVAEDDSYYVKSDQHEQVFTLSKRDFDKITQLSRNTLVAKIDEDIESLDSSDATMDNAADTSAEKSNG